MYSFLYVSRARIPPDRADDEIAAIVAASLAWNDAHNISGALLFTGAMFAQWLEGEQTAVQALMHRIEQDERHCDIVVLEQGLTDRRRFPTWSMAYSGRSTFAAIAVERALRERDTESVHRLTRLLLQLTQMAAQPLAE